MIPKVRSLIDMIFESSSELSKKANSSDVYNKTEIDEKETALNNTINQNKTDLQSNINLKANSSDVYAKTELDDTLLPMTRIKGSTLGDSSTITISVNKYKPYIFINSHFYNREIILITMYNGGINVDRIINTSSTESTSFTLNDNKLTIKASGRCRGLLYELSYQFCS